MITDLPKKAYLSTITVANISQSFTYKMAVKMNWHRYETKLSHCHPMYTNQTWKWVIGSSVQWVICVIFHVRVTGSPGHHFDPV